MVFFILLSALVLVEANWRGGGPVHGKKPRLAPLPGSSDCSVCKDKASCCDNTTCCGSPSICCTQGENCCSGICCSGIEDCCPDPQHGGVCCEKEGTFCCPPTALLPSRCCPRWTICCNSVNGRAGRDGCCDPGAAEPNSNSINGPVYALFGKANLEGGMPLKVLQIDPTSGKKQETPTTFNTFGEIVRSFAWSAQAQGFYLPQANWLVPAPNNVSLWFINVNGTLKNTGLWQNAPGGAPPQGLVTGFCTTAREVVMVATYNPQKTGYLFYSVVPSTGQTTLVSQKSFPNGQDDYSGWFKRCSQDGQTLFRMGFQNPLVEDVFGVGVTSIKSVTATTTFFPVAAPSGYADVFSSFDILSESPWTFLSLVGRDFVGGDFSLAQYSLQPNSARILTKLPDAYRTPDFGPISTAVSSDKSSFSAVITTRSLAGNKYDRWRIVSVSLATNSVYAHDLVPWMIAETDSVAGIGFPM